ncbi:MAG: hypothetical protein ABFD60_18005 [Bryobacteraceae bacterium]
MAFCSKCGSAVEGNFCAKCGASIGGEAVPPTQPVTASGLTDNVAGALCYVLGLITGIIFLLIAPYNQNKAIRFHAFQSIILNCVWIVFWIALGIILPFAVEAVLLPLLSLAFIILWIYLIWKTYEGKKIVLPVIGPIAEKQA